MLGINLRRVAVLAVLLSSSHALGQSRAEVADTLSRECGISPDIWAASGFSSTEVTQKLELIYDSPGLAGEILLLQESLANLKAEQSSCQQQLRSPSQFEGEASEQTEEQLESQFNELKEQIESAQQSLHAAIQSLRITALSSHLITEQILHVTGASGAWDSIPVHWRFGSIEESELPAVIKAYQTAARYTSADEQLPSEVYSTITSIEGQHSVSLALVRIQSSSDSISLAIEQWAAGSP